ncbi:hypothetical protein [Bacillus thuringiensis]|uniref:hypothetical protein n=1 Tax=Bacillus thuringiensis TaxID=1428 RepID=UPI0011A90A2F|nr:hypothetical protein [Bacillus thuringiensis]TWE72325.1 hypothetical protein FHW38_10562 [Bacillus thuringiensis]
MFTLEERKRYLVENKTDFNKEIVIKTFTKQEPAFLGFDSKADKLPQIDMMSWSKVEAKVSIGDWEVKEELEYNL